MWLLIGALMSIGCYSINQSIMQDTVKLSLIFFIPIFIIISILELGCVSGAVFGFGRSMTSLSKPIKIMSIVFFIISLALLGFAIFNTITFFKMI